ncbi:MAG: hypothetical protein LBM69_08875 [Lachnospiraceae bacterium]|jgi:hypothetical protein|nr:hypothetical protein [Lachnospiraceae bacterium]
MLSKSGMFGKLFRFEMKGLNRFGLIILIFLAVDTLLGCLSFLSPIWETVSTDQYEPNAWLNTLTAVSSIGLIGLYVFGMMAISIALVVYFAIRFYRSMYSSGGYLTHTLPVNSHQILSSKLLSATIWHIILTVAMLVSALLFTECLASTIAASLGQPNPRILTFLFQHWGEISAMVQEYTGVTLLGYVLFFVFFAIVMAVCSVMMIYTAITLGQLSAKHKILMSILSYLGIMVINYILGIMTSFRINVMSARIYSTGQIEIDLITPLLINCLLTVAFSIGCYFLCSLIVKRKLNLE